MKASERVEGQRSAVEKTEMGGKEPNTTRAGNKQRERETKKRERGIVRTSDHQMHSCRCCGCSRRCRWLCPLVAFLVAHTTTTNDDDLLNRGKGSSVMSTARSLGCRCARVPPSLIFSERIHRILVSFCRLAFASPDAQPNTIESSRSRQLTAAAIIIGMHPERRQQLFTTTTTKTTRRTSKQYPFGS